MHDKINAMEVTVIEPALQKKFQEITRRIRRLQSGGTLDSLKTIGADTSRQIGASYVSLKELAKTYPPDEKLALLLWNQQKREEQIVACFLFPQGINKEKITQLVATCLTPEIAGYIGSVYLTPSPDLADLVPSFLASQEPFLQIAALTAMARYFIINPEGTAISKEVFKKAVCTFYENKYVQIVAERYRFNI